MVRQIPSQKINWTEECNSTNDLAREFLNNNECNDVVVFAAHKQISGRGQGSNKWCSDDYKNITCSIIIKPENILMHEQFYISMITSLAARDYLLSYNITSSIKWPNDIYVSDKKIGGILIEHNIIGTNVTNSIIGIGLNINQSTFPSSIPNPTSLYNELKNSFNINEELSIFLSFFNNWLVQLNSGEKDMIYNEYLKSLFGFNKWRNFKTNNKVFIGKIINVETTGEIKITDKNNNTNGYFFKEIEFII